LAASSGVPSLSRRGLLFSGSSLSAEACGPLVGCGGDPPTPATQGDMSGDLGT
jgi:hypothetical protein